MRCAVSIITGAGLLLFLLAGQARAVPIEKTLYFQCVYPLIGEQPLTARIATDMPETQPVGEETGAFNLEVTATAEGNTYQGLTLVGAQTIEGIATAYSTVSGEGGLNLPIAVPLTIAQTDISGISGPFDIVATGQGIGFAIPINLALHVMEQLVETGKVQRGFLVDLAGRCRGTFREVAFPSAR